MHLQQQRKTTSEQNALLAQEWRSVSGVCRRLKIGLHLSDMTSGLWRVQPYRCRPNKRSDKNEKKLEKR